jgi:hypothetical protein
LFCLAGFVIAAPNLRHINFRQWVTPNTIRCLAPLPNLLTISMNVTRRTTLPPVRFSSAGSRRKINCDDWVDAGMEVLRASRKQNLKGKRLIVSMCYFPEGPGFQGVKIDVDIDVDNVMNKRIEVC